MPVNSVWDMPVTDNFEGKYIFSKVVTPPGGPEWDFFGETDLFLFDAEGVRRITSNCNDCSSNGPQWLNAETVVYRIVEPVWHVASGLYFKKIGSGAHQFRILDGWYSSHDISGDHSKLGVTANVMTSSTLFLYQITDGASVQLLDKITIPVQFGNLTKIALSQAGDKVAAFLDVVDAWSFLAYEFKDSQLRLISDIDLSNDVASWLSWANHSVRLTYSQRSDIFIVDPLTSTISNLSQTPEIEEYHPGWSPTEDHLVFIRRNDTGSEIVILDVNQNRESIVLSDHEIDTYSNPEWSSDGQYITFNGYQTSPQDGSVLQQGLFLIRRDGTDMKRISDLPLYDFDWFTGN